jgi:hypothetical protein
MPFSGPTRHCSKPMKCSILAWYALTYTQADFPDIFARQTRVGQVLQPACPLDVNDCLLHWAALKFCITQCSIVWPMSRGRWRSSIYGPISLGKPPPGKASIDKGLHPPSICTRKKPESFCGVMVNKRCQTHNTSQQFGLFSTK